MHMGLLVPFCVFGQNDSLSSSSDSQLVRVKGFAQVKVDEDISKLDAKDKAKRLAQINALESAFGTYVEQNTQIGVKDDQVDFVLMGNTKVNGEWLKTISEKVEERVQKPKKKNDHQYALWVECHVEGLARRVSNLPKFEVQTLNCPDQKCKSVEFNDGEQLYLYLRSPEDGYLSVYFQEGKDLFRIFPYHNMQRYIRDVKIIAGEEYVLFSSDKSSASFDKFPSQLTDELLLSSEANVTEQEVHVLFSKQPFDTPMLKSQAVRVGYDEILPMQIDFDHFDEWLLSNRINDRTFQYKKLGIRTVKK